MALVTKVQWTSKERVKLQPTEVVCHVYSDIAKGGLKLVQLDTFGSEERANPGKQSQTLQFTEGSARELVILLKRAFPAI